MSRPPKIPPTMKARIQAVAIIRAGIPTDAQLAAEAGCSRTWVKKLMIEARKRLLPHSDTNSNVPRETSGETVSTPSVQIAS